MLIPLLMNLRMLGASAGAHGGSGRRRRRLHTRQWHRNDDEARREIEQRIEHRTRQTHELAQQVGAKLAREFTDDVLPIETMSQAEIDSEIALLLNIKLRRERLKNEALTNEEYMIVLLLVAASV